MTTPTCAALPVRVEESTQREDRRRPVRDWETTKPVQRVVERRFVVEPRAPLVDETCYVAAALGNVPRGVAPHPSLSAKQGARRVHMLLRGRVKDKGLRIAPLDLSIEGRVADEVHRPPVAAVV